jgi:hypothetical protein
MARGRHSTGDRNPQRMIVAAQQRGARMPRAAPIERDDAHT